jgi:hypothetical protein
MTELAMNLRISEKARQMLADRAAERGKDEAAVVSELIEQAAETGRASKSLEQQAAEFASWMADVEQRAAKYPPGFVADDSRESIYKGRGQ